MAIKYYNRRNPVQITENFNSREFQCPCGCTGPFPIDDALVKNLQAIRDHFGKPVRVSSAYRCPSYNARVGGSKNSNHIKGMAADIWIEELLHEPREIAKYAEQIGVKGIGLYEGSKGQYFVHVDTRTQKTFWESHEERIVSTFRDAQLIQVELRVLKKGARGADVKALQHLLNAYGQYGLAVDGSFGGATERALKAYQAENGLVVDGSCGPATWKHLLGRE